MTLASLPPWVDPVASYMWHKGVPATLHIAAVSVVASTLVGIVLGTLLTVRFLPLRGLIRLYIEVWRGLPILVTIFLIYYGLPSVSHRFSTLGAYAGAEIGLTLWGSAQVAEATRGAVQSIPREQHEAASALGFGWVGRHVHVVVPQALRRLLPPLVGLLVNIIQNSTIASLIGVTELLGTGQREVERLNYSSSDPHAFEIFGAVLAAFFVVSFPLTRLAAFLEKRLV